VAGLYNPAFVGVDEFIDIKASYRTQMLGFGAMAPKAINLSGTFRVKQPADFITNGLRIGNIKALNANAIPKSKQKIHALSVNVFQESYGLIKENGAGLSYAFHYPVTKRAKLALGTTIAMVNRKINPKAIYLGEHGVDEDIIQDLLTQGGSQSSLLAKVGGLLYSKNYYLGISYLPLLDHNLSSEHLTYAHVKYLGMVQGGASFTMSDEFSFKPSIAVLLDKENDLLIDFTMKGVVRDRFWGGITYRSIQACSISAGFEINATLGVSYAYEMALGNFNQASSGSHEVVLGVRINNFKRMNPYTW
jgi:type IX secretion system PorP/SprF family membrane protein